MNAEQSVAVIGQAYAFLLTTYVEPASSATLLQAAWDGFVAALPPDQPRPEAPRAHRDGPARGPAPLPRRLPGGRRPGGGR